MIKQKLLDARLRKGFSQEELADRIGMSQTNYSRRENGLTRISDKEWDRLAKELEVEKDDIFEEDNPYIVYKNNKGNSFNSGTIYFNIPDFVLEHIELLKEQNQFLKKELENYRKNSNN